MGTIVVNRQTNQTEDLPDDQALAGLQAGTHDALIKDQDGVIGTVPYSDFANKLQSGYNTLTSNELNDELQRSQVENESPIETAKAALAGAGNALTLGLSNTVEPEQQAILKKHHPYAYGAGQFAGYMAPWGPVNAELGAAGAAGEGLAGLVGPETQGIVSRALGHSANAATQMSLIGAGDEAAKYINQDPEQTSQSAMANIGNDALIGGITGPIVGGALDLLTRGKLTEALSKVKTDFNGGEPPPPGGPSAPPEAPPLNSKVVSVASKFSGIPEDKIYHYAANKDLVNNSPSAEEIYDQSAPIPKAAEDAFSDAKDNEAQMSQAVKDVKNEVSQVSQSNKDATNQLKQATIDHIAETSSNALDQAPTVHAAVKQLRENNWIDSTNTFDILSQEKENMPLKPLYDSIDKIQDDLRAKTTPENDRLADALDTYKNLVQERHGDSVRPPQAKLLIQGLGNSAGFSGNAAEYVPGLSNKYAQIYGDFNQALKEKYPAYAEATEPLAKNVELLKGLNKYGTPEGAVRGIKNLKTDVNYINEMPKLKELEAATGSQFTEPLERYANPEIREAMRKSLPGYDEAERTAQVLGDLKAPIPSPETVGPFPENHAKLAKAQAMLDDAIGARKAAKGAIDDLGVTSANLQAKIAQALRGNVAAKNALGNLPKINGYSIPELIDALATRQAFEGKSNSGLRGALRSLLSLGAGAAVGHPWLFLEASSAYNTIKENAPAITKGLLDLTIKRNGLGKAAGNVEPGVLRAAVSRMLDSGQPISAGAFRATVNLIQSGMDQQQNTEKAAKGIFKDKDLPTSTQPQSDNSRDKMKESLNEAQRNPASMLETDSSLGQYLPDHALEVGKTRAIAANYLNSLKPQNPQMAPLDVPRVTSRVENEVYNRQLDMADNPLYAFQKIKDGALIPADVRTISTIYPKYYRTMVQELTGAMVEQKANGELIPYKQRLAMSLFMNEPLDSTMTPQGIMSAQSSLGTGMPMQGQPAQAKPKKSMASIGKNAMMSQTPSQARQADLTNKG